MNRRQEVACWVVALALSLVSVEEGWHWGDYDPWFVIFLPLLLLTPLLVYGLRTRSASPRREKRAAGIALSLMLGAAGVGYVVHHLEKTADSVDTVSSQVDDLSSAVSEVSSRLRDLER